MSDKKELVVWVDNPFFTFNNLKKLYSIKYDRRQESFREFLDRYDELVERYNVKPYNDTELSEMDKKETFFQAVKFAVPEIMTVKCIAEMGDKTRCTYEMLRTFFVQCEIQKEDFLREKSLNKRCYRCQKMGHIQYYCPERHSSIRQSSNRFSNSKIDRRGRYTKRYRPYDH